MCGAISMTQTCMKQKQFSRFNKDESPIGVDEKVLFLKKKQKKYIIITNSI